MLWDLFFYYSFLYLAITPLLISDLLINHEVTRLKKMTLSGGNELAELISLSLIGLKVMVFDEMI